MERTAPIRGLPSGILGYAILSLMSLYFAAQPGGFSIFWPANGFFLAWRMKYGGGKDALWGLTPVGVALATNLVSGTPPAAALGFSIANGLEIQTAYWLLVRLRDGKDYLASLPGAFSFFGPACFGAAFVGGLAGSLTVRLAFGGPVAVNLVLWCLVDAAGMSMTAPVVTAWTDSRFRKVSSGLMRGEYLLCALGSFGILALAFTGPGDLPEWFPRPSPYLVLPFFLWAALRCGIRGVTLLLLAAYAFAAWRTIRGFGPYLISAGHEVQGLIQLNLFPAVAAFCAITPAILLAAQRETAERLRSRDSQLGGLWKSSLIGIYITDMNGVIREANETFLGQIGKTRADLEGGRIDMLRMATPEYLAQAQAKREQFLREGQIGPFEREWVLDDGRVFSSLVYASRLEGGELALGMVMGMEELKAARREIGVREARYQDLFSSELIGIFVTDMDGRVTEANDTFLGLIKRTRADLDAGGILTTTMMTRDYEAKSGPERKQAFKENGRIGPFERVWKLADGTELHSLFFATRVRDSGKALCMMVNMDELHSARRELRSVQSRFRSMFDSNVLAAAIVDKKRMLVEANDSFLALTGYARADLAEGLGVDALMVPGNQDARRQAGQAGRNGGLQAPQEIAWRRKDGRTVPVLRGFSSLPDDDGYLVVAMDLSVLKETQAELERANEAKTRFLTHMSHEIRTPLNGVLGMLSMLEGSRLNAEQESHARAARESGKFLLSIVNQVLDYSKLGSDRQELADEPFDIRDVVRGTVATLADQAAGKGLVLESSVAEGVPAAFRGDTVKVQQVMMNLVGNAVKFSRAGAVKLEVEPEGREAGAHLVRVRVIDRGPGIPPSVQARLFRPFEQGDSSLARAEGGTGLGLAICKEIVERMYGRIWVESEPGRGSTFTFVIRLAEAEAPARAEARADSPHGAGAGWVPALRWKRAPRILVVDDHPVNLIVATSMLNKTGCVTETAEEGAAAIRLVRDGDFDLVFMDCQMPGMDGYEATRTIRKLEGRKGALPIVALTAHAVAGVRERCLKEGMDEFISKPFTEEDIRNILARFLPGSGDPGQPTDTAVKPRAAADAGIPAGADAKAGEQLEIDWKRLTDLDDKAEAGTQVVRDLIRLFKDSCRTGLEGIRRASDAKDTAETDRILHKLKGSCATMGAISLHRAVNELEHFQGTPGGFAEGLDRIERLADRTVRAYEERFSHLIAAA